MYAPFFETGPNRCIRYVFGMKQPAADFWKPGRMEVGCFPDPDHRSRKGIKMAMHNHLPVFHCLCGGESLFGACCSGFGCRHRFPVEYALLPGYYHFLKVTKTAITFRAGTGKLNPKQASPWLNRMRLARQVWLGHDAPFQFRYITGARVIMAWELKR